MSTHHHLTKRSNKSERSLRVALPAVLVTALLISLAFTASAHSLWPDTSNFSTEQTSTGAQSAAPSHLTITISSQGITPASATVSAGIVHLTIKNQSSQEQLTLRISRDNGTLVREISSEMAEEWATELELSEPGQYVITVVGTTSGSCQLTAQ